MGMVFRPEDAMKDRKHMLKMALRDLTPGLREPVKNILDDWKGKSSEKKIIKLVGKERARHIIKYYQL